MQEAESEQSKKTTRVFRPFKNIGGLSGWFRALTGRSRLAQKSDQTQSSGQEVAGQVSEDSVTQDIRKLSDFLKRTSGRYLPSRERAVGETSGPLVYKDRNLSKKLIKILLFFLFLLVLVFVGVRFFQLVNEEGGTTENAKDTKTSPTPPAVYRPYKPSIYADDPEVLRLEKDINVIERELGRTSVREDSLLPPRLDFDIKF